MSQTVDERLEQAIGDYFWAPDGIEIIERPSFHYASSELDVVNFNSVFWCRPTPANAVEMVREVSEVHGERGSRWLVTHPCPEFFDALADAGYALGHRHYAYAIAVDDYERTSPAKFHVKHVQTLDELRDLDVVLTDVFGDKAPLDAAELQRQLDALLGPDARVARFVVYDDEEPVASAGVTRFDDVGLGMLWAGGTREKWRGQGAYTALLRARIDWAKRVGLREVGLYARTTTSAPIVENHGFTRHGPMEYWDRNVG